MRSLAIIRSTTPKSEICRGQIQHPMLAILLTIGACALLRDEGSGLWGVSAMTWAKLAIAFALIHQIVVAIIFRLQLHLDLMVRIFGDRALKIWGVIFLPLLVARPLLILATGLASIGTLEGSRTIYLVAGLALLAPAIWGMHSVIKYFTIPHALGGDHFYDSYANMPLVDQGLFKYSKNGMYSIVFLGLWGIALLTGSWDALVVAFFQHAYIWAHMYCTEDPDMRIIYRDVA